MNASMEDDGTIINTDGKNNVDLTGKDNDLAADSDISDTLNENPNVSIMIHRFQQGEMMHRVETCKTCNETRPIYHETDPSETFVRQGKKPYVFDNWKMFNDNRCFRCHNETITNRRKASLNTAAKFSGIYSVAEDIGFMSQTETVYNNNMHFAEVPFFLKSLTLMETLMIRKIQVAMYVHSLKYGMLASKGHAISIPHDMKIATSLPLLPSEISILLLKRKNASSKHYFVSRKKSRNSSNWISFWLSNLRCK